MIKIKNLKKPTLIAEIGINHNGSISEELKADLALEAFQHTARYDTVISNYLASVSQNGNLRFLTHDRDLGAKMGGK